MPVCHPWHEDHDDTCLTELGRSNMTMYVAGTWHTVNTKSCAFIAFAIGNRCSQKILVIVFQMEESKQNMWKGEAE
jgi:hypothetical protein